RGEQDGEAGDPLPLRGRRRVSAEYRPQSGRSAHPARIGYREGLVRQLEEPHHRQDRREQHAHDAPAEGDRLSAGRRLRVLSERPPSTEPAGVPSVCVWPGDRRWVYSITFDEALSDLHRFTIPILEEFGVPGHLEVVVGQMGELRNLPGSSFHGYKHMGAEELREMIARGWGVGNHSWSHQVVNAETADLELGRAKEVLEQAIGQPVTVYCAPGSNANMNEGALAGCRRFGYLGAMGITDALNRPGDEDLLWLNRTFLHTQGYGPFFSEFDPFRNLQHARRDRGWIID